MLLLISHLQTPNYEYAGMTFFLHISEGESTIPTATETDEPMAPVLTEETQPGIEQLEIEGEPGCEQLAQITETEWKNVRSSLQGIQKQLQIITMQQFQFMQMMAAKNQQNIVDDGMLSTSQSVHSP